MVPGYAEIQQRGQSQAVQGHVTNKWILVLDARRELEGITLGKGEGLRSLFTFVTCSITRTGL